MRRRLRNRHHHTPNVDIDITAFMNLMVILVPFLLITAVFSQITVLDLYLPSESSGDAQSNEKMFHLDVIIRKDAIEVIERSSGLSKLIENIGGTYDMDILSQTIQSLKERFPEKTEATILSESNIKYDLLVQVMDNIRVKDTIINNRVDFKALFPDISIGDAPTMSAVIKK